jgi:integrase/recombinase XerD
MYIYKKDGITAATVLDTRRRLTNDLYRVRVRVTFNRKTREYSTGKALTINDWMELPKAKSKVLKDAKHDIQNTFLIIEKHIRNLAESEAFSFDALDNELQRKSDSNTINEYFKDKIHSLDEDDREGTRLYYDNVLKGIERFKGKSIALKLISAEWLKGYEKFLLSEKKSYTTIGMHMRAIRAMVNTAKKKGIIKELNYPFGGDRYQIPTGDSRKMALTIDQIGKIVSFYDGSPKTDLYRDLWFFSYLCNGINFADVCRLKYADISNNEITWLREKTKNTAKQKKYIRASLTTEMQTIIKRWGTEHLPDNYIFPFITPGLTTIEERNRVRKIISSVNQQMKYIGEKTGAGKISTYTARHSYATVLKRSGANVAYISESLGHSDLKTTENYLASFEQTERAKNAALLTDFKTPGQNEK